MNEDLKLLARLKRARKRDTERDAPQAITRHRCLNKLHRVILTTSPSRRPVFPGRASTPSAQESDGSRGTACRACLELQRLFISEVDTGKGRYRALGYSSRRLSDRLRGLADDFRPAARRIDWTRWERKRLGHILRKADRALAEWSFKCGEAHTEKRDLSDLSRKQLAYWTVAKTVGFEIANSQITGVSEEHAYLKSFSVGITNTAEGGCFTKWVDHYTLQQKSTAPYADHAALQLTDGWFRDVYCRFGKRAVIEDRAIPLVILGELGPDRYKVKAAVRKPDPDRPSAVLGGVTPYVAFSSVTGVVYKRPFGKWAFLQLSETVESVEAVA